MYLGSGRRENYLKSRIVTTRIRRMGKVMFSVCPHLGGYPYPIMLCNITQNSMGQTPRVGTWPGPAEGVTLLGVPCWGYPARGYPAGGYPVRRLPMYGTPRPGQDGGYPSRVPPSQVRNRGVPYQGIPM